MGKYGYKITLTEEAYANFKKVKELLEVRSWEELSEKVLELIERHLASASGRESIEGAKEERYLGAKCRSKTRAIDVLRERKVMYEADIVSRIRNRDVFFEKLRGEGAVVIETVKQRVAVDPVFWDEFKRRLEEVGTAEGEVLEEHLGKEGFKLLRTLRDEGVLYFDGVERKWKFVE